MGKFDGLLLASDFDDTLYDLTFHIPERNLEAIRYFIHQGGFFTVATGRAHRTFAPYAPMVPMNAPAVLSNGAAIYDFQKDEMVEQTLLDQRAPADLGALMGEFPSLSLEAYHGEDIYIWNPNEITMAHMKKVACDYTICPVHAMPTPWVKALFHQEHEVLVNARERLLSRWADRYEAIFSNPRYLEITRKGSTKGGMVARLAQILGVRPEHVYCVGDNQNDIPMLEKSAIPFAPANCAQEVKDWGARILCHCNDGVIGDIVEVLDKLY
ncbi:HAD-IIB family hydrolase [Lawsonibacter sp. LCP25S3_G6]|uniref:HAD-IIB family hydrolase n=1 Tax=unclassified Lawsonibacter TaxID=2617946 RepID=UPI003F95A0F0